MSKSLCLKKEIHKNLFNKSIWVECLPAEIHIDEGNMVIFLVTFTVNWWKAGSHIWQFLEDGPSCQAQR